MADQQEQKTGFFGRLKGALSRTREGLASGLASLFGADKKICLLYTSPSPRDGLLSRMPSSA